MICVENEAYLITHHLKVGKKEAEFINILTDNNKQVIKAFIF